MVRPWAEAGHTCHCFDIQNVARQEGNIHFHGGDLSKEDRLDYIVLLKPDIIFSFPPCTDLAVSGAAHFARKRAMNPEFQEEAISLMKTARDISDMCGLKHGYKPPWMAENPISVAATMWRKPDHYFSPYEYGGYLPEDDIHPRWPQFIPPRDAYPKTTCIWDGNGFKMPDKKPVPMDPEREKNRQSKLGGKSARTKQIRSETPRGFAQAVFEANAR